MSWKSSADIIEHWGCRATADAYHTCMLDTYQDGVEYPWEIRIRLRKWDSLFSNCPALYFKFKYKDMYIRLWEKD